MPYLTVNISEKCLRYDYVTKPFYRISSLVSFPKEIFNLLGMKILTGSHISI